MWKAVVLISFASVVLQVARAQGGAESLPFSGYVPWENVMGSAPEGDGQPNDIYQHIELALQPRLAEDEVVFYPKNIVGLGLEFGQDAEEKVYRIYTNDEVAQLQARKMKKHGKHSKNSHDHQHHNKHSKDSVRGKDFGRPSAPASVERPSQAPNYNVSPPGRPNPSAPYPYRFPPRHSHEN